MENKKDNEFASENIFDDFSTDKWLWKEIKDIEKEQSRDIYYYISILSSMFRFVNIILFLIIFTYFFYAYIQEKEELKEYSFLNPICSIILWESADAIDECYPVNAYLTKKEIDLKNIKKTYSQQVINVIGNAYTMENFINSKSILFLTNKSKDKFDPIKIISEFDTLKNKFEPFDKSRVVCNNLNVTNENKLQTTCIFYSSDWDIQITDKTSGNNESRPWTSISLALSFIDFIENSNYSTFSVLNKPKTFSTSDFSWLWRYTKSTTVNFDLKYNDIDNLKL